MRLLNTFESSGLKSYKTRKKAFYVYTGNKLTNTVRIRSAENFQCL